MPLWQMSVVIQQELVAQMPGGVAVAGRSTLGQRSWTSAHGRVFMDERSWIGVQAFAHLLSEARRKRQSTMLDQRGGDYHLELVRAVPGYPTSTRRSA